MKSKKLSIKIFALILCLSMVLPLCACGDSEPVQKQVFAMDTIMTLTAYGDNAEAGLNSAAGVITALHKMVDPDSEDSYVYLLNNAGGEDIAVPAQVAEMLNTAITVYQRSNGALDLSTYPIYLAWGEFSEETGRVPDDEELRELRNRVGFSGVTVTSFKDESNYYVHMPEGCQISFGSIAKGCAAKYAIESMRAAGIESGLVSLGGNVQTLGTKPDGSDWVIAIEDPQNTGNYLGTVTVGETAVVTSGSYQRYFKDTDGEKYHHIINPRTARPTDNGLLSVTILCEDGTTADALSTAMFVLGEDAALQYWRDYGGFEMIMVNEDNQVTCTSGLIEIFKLTNTDKYTVQMVE